MDVLSLGITYIRVLVYRLIHGIDMDITYISTMKNGVKVMMASHFSTGEP